MSIEQWTGYEVSEATLLEAANWIASLDRNELDDDQQIAFHNWLQSEPANQHAYLELSELWAKSACLNSVHEFIEKSVVIPFPSEKKETVSEPVTHSAGPGWAYTLTIGLICFGMTMPIIQHFV
ncbi:FecR/PupR family sigma factor regulator [Aliiglaciecola sp. NS0011-25]|uniref:FecR/PupR family sigma factor regulator n=1 Tax=Aliiglaciecola sp. NS0011-25 TaxID=3127654 RepID=UPI00310BE1C3